MVFKYRMMTVISVLFMVATGFFNVNSQIRGQDSLPIAPPFYMRPNFAQFINSDYILMGNTEGLHVIEIESGSIVKTALEGVAISTMMGNPHKNGQVAIGTETGEVYFVSWINDELNLVKAEEIEDTSVNIVRSILYHVDKPDRIALADHRYIALGVYQDNQIDIQQVVHIDEPDKLTVMIFPDNTDSKWFLISTTQDGRFRVNWETGEIVSIPESILEHGYRTGQAGVSYFAWGDRQEFLNIRFLNNRAIYTKKHPTLSDTYLFATIGISPLRLTIDQTNRNHYTVDYLYSNRHLTFSIDVDRNNPERMIFTTSRGVLISHDEGQNWTRIGESP